MPSKVVISFVGGRPLPNIQFILNEKPDRLYLISSKDSAGKDGNKEKLIHALPTELKPYDSFDVNPYVMQETIEKCEQIFQENQANSLIFQLSSEPTTMALAVYKFVLQKNAPNISLYYSSRDGIIDTLEVESHPPQKIKISIQDYFKVYGWNIGMKQATNEQLSKLIELFLVDITVTHELLLKMRQNYKGNKSNIITIPSLNPAEFALLEKMYQAGFIVSISKPLFFQIEIVQAKANLFIKGDWLEYFIYKTAKNQNNFDECAWNVSDEQQVGELDFVGILNGQLVIASCKTENGIKVEFLKELSARADQLGKGMCTKLFVTTYCPNATAQYEKWAKEYHVSIIYGYDLKDMATKLKEAIGDRSRI